MLRTIFVFSMITMLLLIQSCALKMTGTKYPLEVKINHEKDKKISTKAFLQNIAKCARGNKNEVDTFGDMPCLGGIGKNWADDFFSNKLILIKASESITKSGKPNKYTFIFKHKTKTTLFGFPKGYVLELLIPFDKNILLTFSRHKDKNFPPLAYCYKFDPMDKKKRLKVANFQIVQTKKLEIKKNGTISWTFDSASGDWRPYMCFSSKDDLEEFLSSFLSTFDGFDWKVHEFEDNPVK